MTGLEPQGDRVSRRRRKAGQAKEQRRHGGGSGEDGLKSRNGLPWFYQKNRVWKFAWIEEIFLKLSLLTTSAHGLKWYGVPSSADAQASNTPTGLADIPCESQAYGRSVKGAQKTYGELAPFLSGFQTSATAHFEKAWELASNCEPDAHSGGWHQYRVRRSDLIRSLAQGNWVSLPLTGSRGCE